MCSGRIDLSFILKAFNNGADGVYIAACKLGECNYTTQGNYHALNMVLLCKRILEYIGINPERLNIEFMSAADGSKFAETVEQFTQKIRKLGQLEQSDKIEGILKLIPYIKIAKRKKLAKPLGDKSEWDGLFTLKEIEQMFQEVPSYYINPDKCQACGTCLRRCPADAISGGKNIIHQINQDKCIKCGTCYEACPPKFKAISILVGESVPDPLPEEKRIKVRKKQKTGEV